jgi:NAD(P)-dependent dehydrogenase (short-subunit alcohol dehydrogenase family)
VSPGDVSDEEQVATLVQRCVATFGRLDFAFNNAGIQAPSIDAADEPAETFDGVHAVNLRGVWACMKHELGQMRQQGSGAIVNCSSLGGLVGLPGLPRLQARRPRPHQERRARIRAPRHTHQRDLPGNDRDADGRRHARQGRARHGRGDRQPADRAHWAPDGDLVFYYDSDAPYFNGIVRIGEFDGEMDAIEGQGEDFSATIEPA